MTEQLIFSAYGTPRPKTRPRFVRGKVVSHANPHEKLWKKAVERAAFAAVIYRGDPIPLFSGPVSVRMIFMFEPPKSARKRIGTPHTIPPDKDNLEKLVLDAMTRAGVFKDDSQVAGGEVTKLWGGRAGVVVLTEQIDGQLTQPPGAASPEPPCWLTANEASSRAVSGPAAPFARCPTRT